MDTANDQRIFELILKTGEMRALLDAVRQERTEIQRDQELKNKITDLYISLELDYKNIASIVEWLVLLKNPSDYTEEHKMALDQIINHLDSSLTISNNALIELIRLILTLD